MVLDLMHVQNFHSQLVNEVRMLLFLVLSKVYRGILIIKKKEFLFLGEKPTDGADDTTITTKAKY